MLPARMVLCEPGWQLNPLAVHGVEVCNQPRGFLQAAYTAWLAIIASNTALTLVLITLDGRSGRLESRLKRVIGALQFVFLVSSTCAIGLSRATGMIPNATTTGALLMYIGACALDFGGALNFHRIFRSVRSELKDGVAIDSFLVLALTVTEKVISGAVLQAFMTGQIHSWTVLRYGGGVQLFVGVVWLTSFARYVHFVQELQMDELTLRENCFPRIVGPVLSMYELALEGLSGPQSSGNAVTKARMLVTYAELKEFSGQGSAFQAVNMIVGLPFLLSIAFPIVLSYMVFVIPVLYSAISLSHFIVLCHLIYLSVLRSREIRSAHSKSVTSIKIVPVGTSDTNALSKAAGSVHSKAASVASIEKTSPTV